MKTRDLIVLELHTQPYKIITLLNPFKMEIKLNCTLHNFSETLTSKNGLHYQKITVKAPKNKKGENHYFQFSIFGEDNIMKFWNGNPAKNSSLSLVVDLYINGEEKANTQTGEIYYNINFNYKSNLWITPAK